jgi:CheY-like chemotaxis protein
MAHILIVDDYTVTVHLVSTILERAGHTVGTAGDGEEALNLLIEQHSKKPFDLVVADVDMPRMDGITLLQHIRNDARFYALPVIILTASGIEEDRANARALGANGFLTKPSGSKQILEVIQQILGLEK